MFSAWETFSEKRYEKGREDGREEQAKRIAELKEEREALSKRVAEFEKVSKERDR